MNHLLRSTVACAPATLPVQRCPKIVLYVVNDHTYPEWPCKKFPHILELRRAPSPSIPCNPYTTNTNRNHRACSNKQDTFRSHKSTTPHASNMVDTMLSRRKNRNLTCCIRHPIHHNSLYYISAEWRCTGRRAHFCG